MKKLYLLALFSLSLVTVFCQTVYTFTNAGATGITGPNQTQVNSAYSATNLNGQVTVIGSGIQDWIVPYTGEYTISAAGASGGNANTALGGKGREITIQLNLTAGHHLRILVGQKGGESSFNNSGCFGSDPGYVGGGGGGTFVFNQTTNSLIIATGGGGGAAFGAYFGSYPGVDASLYNQTSGANGGTASSGSPGNGGTAGNGGTTQGGGSSGGGYTGNGSNGYYGGIYGQSFTNGGQGGSNGISSGSLISTINGGFGGGAGASNHSCYEADGGGGGGYSGGGGSGFRIGAGGGGGNYYTGTYISNSLNTGHGKCLITRLFGVDIDQTAYNCGGASTGELIAQVNGGIAPFTYLWSNGETTQTISNLAPGTYSVIVTDNVGETTNSSITISDPIINSSIVGTNFLCSNGSIPNKTVTSIQYRWMTSGTYGNYIYFSVNGTNIGGTYTEYDFNCYENVQTLTVTNPSYLSNLVNGSNTFGYNVYADYFGWVKAILTFSDATTQTVIISDPTGQAASEGNYTCGSGNPYSSPVTANISLTTTYSPYPGTLNLTTTQPNAYTYLWETGATTEDIVVSTPGYYTVTINQAECGYSLTDSVFVTGPTNTISSVVIGDTCGPTNLAMIDVSISGFTAPLSYLWSNGQTTQDVSNLTNGNYTLTVTDASGCGPVVSAPITVLKGDVVIPNALCKDTTIILSNTGTVSINPTFVNNGSNDLCSAVTYSLNNSNFNCSNLGANTVIMTVYDNQNNSSTCSSIVTVIDTIRPTFVTTPSSISVNAISNLCGKVVTYNLPTFIDNCSATLSKTDLTGLVSGDIFSVGTTTLEYTISDLSGNSSVYSFTITVIDNQSPQITNCPSNITIDANTTNCGANVNWVSPTASDNCPGVVLTSTHSPGSLFPVGTTTVTYTAVDASNDSTTCSFTVTVNDATAPAVPTLATLTGQCSVTATVPTAIDNCAGTIIGTTTDALTYSTEGSYTIHWTFDDGNGNISTANQTVIVDDVTAPVAPTLATLTGQCSVTATAPTTTDNCVGTINGTTTNPLTYTAEGTYTIVWTFNDGNGNVSTANQTVIVDDITAPAVPSLATLTGQCSVTATTPTTTDNCAGTITGTTSTVFPITAQGTHTVVWSFNDGNGNVSTANQIVIVDDNTVPFLPTLLTLNGECSVTASIPTTTDNCVSTITGTTTDPLTYTTQGTHTITWSFDDGNGNVSTANQTVIVDDITAPVVPTLATLTGQCSVTATAPTTTDNCAGTITGTTTNPLTYTAEGTYTIVWSFNDGNGNVSTANQTVIVDDITAPTVPTLATLTSQCSVTATAPTTTDNCAGNITGTTTNPLTYTTEGTYTIVWSFNDGNGNISTANQTVIVDDITAPVVPTLATLTGQCSVTATSPTTTDNCAGTITGTTTNPLTYTAEGTYTIVWSFNDGNGNVSTANQTVIVDDITAPTVPTLATLTGQCSVTATVPTTTDNCAGTITGTTTNPLTYTAEGTYAILWTFNDGNGNSSFASQTVIVNDVTAPVAPTLASIVTSCSATASIPTAVDNCAGTISGTTTTVFPITTQGTHTVVWSFNDGNGNVSTANQTVIVDDNTAPAVPTLATLTGQCSVTVTAPTTTDNCAGTITGTTTNPLTYSTQGTFTIVWSFNDGNGNVSTANQTVIVDDNTAPAVPTLATLTGQCSVTATVPTTTDNCAGTITGTTTNPLTYSTQGTFTIVWSFNDGNGNVSTANQTVIVDDVTAPVAPTLATLTGQCSVTATAPTTTDNCAGTITGTTTNPLTYTTQGTHSVVWTFNDGNGNVSTATQLVIVDDNTNPSTPSLPVVMVECGTTLTAPTTTDACSGVITGTTSNQTSFTSQGTFFVLWTFNDGNGNTTFAGQTVIVDDVTAPVAPTLATLTGDCSVTATAPTTTDNCAGTITGTTSGPVTFTTQGTHTIVWTFNDGNGNTSTATQLVVIDDNTAPTITTPTDLTVAVNANGCVASNVSLGSLVATDNCGIQTITNDAPVVYPVGTTVVTWTVTDNSGNTSTAQQTVTVTNNVNATITVVTCGSYTAPDDSVYTISGVYTSVIPSVFGCDSTITINLTINNATDSLITATDCSSFELNGQTYTATGIYTQVLTNSVGCDSLITLDLVILGGDFATATYSGDSSLVAGPETAYQWINCATGSVIVGETSDTLSITSNGSYAVIVTNANGCSDTSDCVVIEDLGVKQLSSLELEVYPNPTRDFVHLEMSVSTAEVVIYDAAGKIINKMNVNTGEVIDFRNVEPGVYFLHINAENSETIKRIVKQ